MSFFSFLGSSVEAQRRREREVRTEAVIGIGCWMRAEAIEDPGERTAALWALIDLLTVLSEPTPSLCCRGITPYMGDTMSMAFRSILYSPSHGPDMVGFSLTHVSLFINSVKCLFQMEDGLS
jgi:hypothetical protein